MMSKQVSHKLFKPHFTLGIIAVTCIFIMFKWSWKTSTTKDFKQIIKSDGIGYYQYLPNTFLNGTISNQKVDNRYVFNTKSGKSYNKYYVGTSLLMSPFFTLGHITATLQGTKTDGYSPPYQKAINIGGLFYLIIGIYFLSTLLKLHHFKHWQISVSLLLITFGTNLLNYAILEPSMSHVYSFFGVAGFLFFYKKYALTAKTKFHYYGAFFLVLIILIRPLNGIILLSTPLLFNSWAEFISKLKSLLTYKTIIYTLLISTILFIQPLFWFIQTGSFIIWSYKNEGFEFLTPHFYEILLSFRKGWFIYTPLATLSILGIFLWYKQNRFQAIYFICFLTLFVYLIASWWNWYYGPSFSQRPFVEFYPLLVIPLAYLLKSKLKYGVILVATLFVFLNVFQTYQYHHHIISAWDMNFNKYAYTFLKHGVNYENCLGGNRDIMPYNSKKETIISAINNFETQKSNWITGEHVMINENTLSNYNKREFNTTFSYSFSLKQPAKRGLFIEINIKKHQVKPLATKDALMVITTKGENNYKDYYAFKIDEAPSTKTNKLQASYYTVEIPDFRGKNGEITVYCWNKTKNAFYIDDFGIEISCIRDKK